MFSVDIERAVDGTKVIGGLSIIFTNTKRSLSISTIINSSDESFKLFSPHYFSTITPWPQAIHTIDLQGLAYIKKAICP
jgi:hypothetical protein